MGLTVRREMQMQCKVTTSRRKEGEVMHDDYAGVTPRLIGVSVQRRHHE